MGCSSFAERAMIPALIQSELAELVCVASRLPEKSAILAGKFGCRSVSGYEGLLDCDDVDAVYMPLPTGLHEEWCKKALKAGKHLLIEKSFAMDLASAQRITNVATEQNLLVVENFQFQTHSQWAKIKQLIGSGEIGDVHLVRSTFGFPPLPKDNFRWNRDLGGGALLDTGAYVVKVSQLLLGAEISVLGAALTKDPETNVDLYGEAMFRNSSGQVAQVAFGFDYFYQCRVELLGTKGKLSAGRVFTAPPGFEPTLQIEKQSGTTELKLSADNHYLNMWNQFAGDVMRCDYSGHMQNLMNQARVLDEITRCAVTSIKTLK